MNVGILGAGAWGTAIAIAVAGRHPTRLWTRDAAQAAEMASTRANGRYLPGCPLPPALLIDTDFDRVVAHATDGLLLVATPMAALRELLRRLPAREGLEPMWLCKGLEEGTGLLGHEVAEALRPGRPAGVLSGPSFALEVACGQPTALVACSRDATLCERAVEALHGDALRIYTSSDPVGVEIGGAVKNVMALATGIADGLHEGRGLGLNARAALITRGLAEMTRLGVALGARAETFMGLSGLGDLVLTATGDLSRNRRVGQLLAGGLPLDRILHELGHVAEGVYSAATVLTRAHEAGVEMPITEAVVSVLEGRSDPAAAVSALMRRDARAEA